MTISKSILEKCGWATDSESKEEPFGDIAVYLATASDGPKGIAPLSYLAAKDFRKIALKADKQPQKLNASVSRLEAALVQEVDSKLMLECATRYVQRTRTAKANVEAKVSSLHLVVCGWETAAGHWVFRVMPGLPKSEFLTPDEVCDALGVAIQMHVSNHPHEQPII